MTERIMVGVDGSAEAAAALEHAAREAVRRGARLQVVSVATLPASWGFAEGTAPAPGAPGFDLVGTARATARAAVDALLEAHPGLIDRNRVEIVGLDGHPVTELVAQSSGADLLVLGHRGRGALASALLGSVGLSCVLHAHCPVTIVRPAADRQPQPAG